MAIKAALGDSGFAVFDDWSRGGKSYQQTDCRDTWKSIKPGGGTTIKTLFKMAHDAGWQWTPSPRTKTQDKPYPGRQATNHTTPKHDPETIWAACLQEIHEHTYLRIKAVHAFGLRLYPGRLVIGGMDCNGALAMLLVDGTGKAKTIQFIGASGEKRFLPDCPKKGAFHVIGTLTEIIVICEGYATGATIYMATGYLVVVAVDSGNLIPVSQTILALYPHHTIILAADDDSHLTNNPGLSKTTEAAAAIGGYLAKPNFGPNRPEGATDFNDLAAHLGLEAVSAQLTAAKKVEPKAETTKDELSLDVEYRCMSDVRSEPVQWLWKGRIAKRKLTIIAGDPGTGKSQATLHIAAIVSKGGTFPDGSKCPAIGNVVLITVEDDAGDTVKPRLEAYGADMGKIFILEAIRDKGKKRGFNLQDDITRLEGLINKIGGAAAVVVDPVSAYCGNADSYKNSDVRALLSPLTELAGRLGLAVIVVSHLAKTGSSAMNKISGSLGFIAAARAGYLVVKDPHIPERRLFLPVKNNIGVDQTGFAYRIEPVTVPSGVETSRVVWEPDAVDITPDAALAAQCANVAEKGALDEATGFLNDLLQYGPVDARKVKQEARLAGISEASINRAKATLGIKPRKELVSGKWRWGLPAMDEQVANLECLDQHEHVEHLDHLLLGINNNICNNYSESVNRGIGEMLQDAQGAQGAQDIQGVKMLNNDDQPDYERF